MTDRNNKSTQNRIASKPPRQPGTLGEMLTAVLLSLMYAEQNGTSAAYQWDAARDEAARRWRRNK
ncbi:hypothetical protein Q31b_42340 [Novipirellula aureliae]|uniref:Uncharacterized protein n=1 Tax=Novipirellula aureliae TaxID=2527966 RepID=A0A5C6DWE3_9BACT|nr:hypothetical protein [Novipirellula aureliae]TWU39149.1 hypothetical protein Q31b_42340 [Novipirellula aureliae]